MKKILTFGFILITFICYSQPSNIPITSFQVQSMGWAYSECPNLWIKNDSTFTVVDDTFSCIIGLRKVISVRDKYSIEMENKYFNLVDKYNWLVDQYNARLAADKQLINSLRKTSRK